MDTLEALRHAEQQAFVASGAELALGSLQGLPWDAAALQQLQPGDAGVLAVVDSGLSSQVLCVQHQGQRFALKRRRAQPRVHNRDGELSFLNELLRRAELAPLHQQDPERWRGVQGTRWASWQHGLVLCPWIDGGPVAQWDERRLQGLLTLLCSLWLEGFFEWDPSAGNVLDDGQQLHLFDFGYCYRFDPQQQFNSAGHGGDEPLFHPAERFETRCYAAVLMQLEQRAGSAAALQAFRLEKQVALAAYQAMRSEAARRGASAAVLGWLEGWCRRWHSGLQGDLSALYLAECWRSHVLDLDDDLRGRSCTPTTIQRANWLLTALAEHESTLRGHGAFFWGDEALSRRALHTRYESKRQQALQWQLPGSG